LRRLGNGRPTINVPRSIFRPFKTTQKAAEMVGPSTRERNRNTDDRIRSIPEHRPDNICEPNRASGDALAAFTGHEAMTRLDEDLAYFKRAKPEGEFRVELNACRSDSHKIPCNVRKSRGNSADHTSGTSAPRCGDDMQSPLLVSPPRATQAGQKRRRATSRGRSKGASGESFSPSSRDFSLPLKPNVSNLRLNGLVVGCWVSRRLLGRRRVDPCGSGFFALPGRRWSEGLRPPRAIARLVRTPGRR
jgi:hypothetical protein